MYTWSDLTNEERNALVAAKVLGLNIEHWTQDSYEDVDEDGNPVIFSLRTGYVLADDPLHPPIARYTTDWNAAWQVLQRMIKEYHPFRESYHSNQEMVFKRFAAALLEDEDWVYDNKIYPGRSFFPLVLKWSPSKICFAALRAHKLIYEEKWIKV